MAPILLIEDDLDVRLLLEHILIEAGYHITAAETVATATAFLGSQPFDLVICDVNLPDGSGLTIADRAMAAGAKALVITGHGLTLKPGDLESYDYVLNPVRAIELLFAIERRLAEKSGAAEVVDFPRHIGEL